MHMEAIMAIISAVIQLVGLILLIFGFRNANRNLMLGAALLLWFGAGSEEFAHGFMQGIHESRPAVEAGRT
jgi:hypothetical protein